MDPLLAALSEHIMTLRFRNRIFEPTWNYSHVQSVEITFKHTSDCNTFMNEDHDAVVLFRDIALRAVALIAMESPASLSPEDVSIRMQY